LCCNAANAGRSAAKTAAKSIYNATPLTPAGFGGEVAGSQSALDKLIL
jgi:hypothetical protein